MVSSCLQASQSECTNFCTLSFESTVEQAELRDSILVPHTIDAIVVGRSDQREIHLRFLFHFGPTLNVDSTEDIDDRKSMYMYSLAKNHKHPLLMPLAWEKSVFSHLIEKVPQVFEDVPCAHRVQKHVAMEGKNHADYQGLPRTGNMVGKGRFAEEADLGALTQCARCVMYRLSGSATNYLWFMRRSFIKSLPDVQAGSMELCLHSNS